MSEDKFFNAANKLTQARTLLEKAGFTDRQTIELQSTFLALMMTESSLVREYRQKAITKIFQVFSADSLVLVFQALQHVSGASLTNAEFMELAERPTTKSKLLNNTELDSVLSLMLKSASSELNRKETANKNLIM